MASMVHKAGTALQTGATDTGITGLHTQTSGRNAAGELRIIRDKDGVDLSAYVTDPHDEMSFEAVMAANVADKGIGDIVTISTKNYFVTQWQVTESNEDVKKVSIGLRSTTLSAPAAQTPAAQTPSAS